MRLLLDTHIAVWAIIDSPKLPHEARRLIADAKNEINVSVASIWEIGVKHGLKRKGSAAMPVSASSARDYFTAAGYGLIPITVDHAIAVSSLPTHHADPFDRMLIAQAMSEPMRLLTHDEALSRYGDCVRVV